MTVLEHEEMLRVAEQSFFIDVAMVGVVEAVANRFDRAADDLLEGGE
jgi:hypothetical protein